MGEHGGGHQLAFDIEACIDIGAIAAADKGVAVGGGIVVKVFVAQQTGGEDGAIGLCDLRCAAIGRASIENGDAKEHRHYR